MDLLRGELGSSNETCVTSILHGNDVNDTEAERISNVIEEEDQVPRTVPVIKTEPTVSVVLVMSVTHISYGLYPELHARISVSPCERKMSL
jgi:S-adenosylmethionine/arginine decarboxylase-like enzyme